MNNKYAKNLCAVNISPFDLPQVRTLKTPFLKALSSGITFMYLTKKDALKYEEELKTVDVELIRSPNLR